MAFYEQFLDQTKFGSYEDYLKNFHVNVPENFNYAFDVLDKIAEAEPDRVALVWEHVDGREKTLTFGDIAKKSNQAARALQKMGIQKGDAVMLVLKRHYSFWYTIMALHKLGAITVPATHLLTKKDIVYRGNAAKVCAVVCVNDPFVMEQVEAAQGDIPTLQNKILVVEQREGWLDLNEEMEKFSDEFPRPTGEEATRWDDTMLVYFTSGTTGMPKMVAHSFTYPLGHIVTGRFWHNLDENSIHLTTADSGWAKCGWGKFYGQWLCGATLFVYDFDRFHANNLLAMLAKYRVTSFCAPPTIYRYMIKEDMASYDLSALKWGTVAGEPLNPEVFYRFKEFTGVELREAFGQTENSPLALTPKWMAPKPGSIGKPSPHYHIRLLDAEGRDVEPGEEGEICVDISQRRPAGLFVGYYKDEERTREAFAGGVYRTGDMAWCDEEGYYWFIGRADDVIKSSGYRIGPFEVESALISHPAVVECAITGVPDPDRGQVVKATVVLAKGYEPSDELRKELQRHVKQVTAPYKYPRILEFVEELPKTVSGKIQRAKLRKEDEAK